MWIVQNAIACYCNLWVIPFLCSICTFNQQPAGKDYAIKNALIRIVNCTENSSC